MFIFPGCHVKTNSVVAAPTKTMEAMSKVLKRKHGSYKEPLSKKSKHFYEELNYKFNSKGKHRKSKHGFQLGKNYSAKVTFVILEPKAGT